MQSALDSLTWLGVAAYAAGHSYLDRVPVDTAGRLETDGGRDQELAAPVELAGGVGGGVPLSQADLLSYVGAITGVIGARGWGSTVPAGSGVPSDTRATMRLARRAMARTHPS